MKFEAHVEDIVRRTREVKSFRFARPTAFMYDPGQWMIVTIPVNGERKTKHFTISSSPSEREFLEFTKKITTEEFSVALDMLRPGDPATIDGPYGDFTFRGEFPKVGMITGGIGITPLRSMIRYCTDTGVQSDIVLLYGNRNEESIIFREELGELVQRNPNLKLVHCLSRPDDSWKGRRGHVDREAIIEEIPEYLERAFFICGPPALVDDLAIALSSLSVPESRIRTEHFTGY
jgi:ferredoxin-NADP reductase